VVSFAIDTLFLIFAVDCLMARLPTVHTQSSALASSRAMAVLLAVKQRRGFGMYGSTGTLK